MGDKDCALCAFENPKATATAIVIKDGKLLVAKRNEEPFKGQWDFIGGYIQKNETSEEALRREIKEELSVDVASAIFVREFTGTAQYQDRHFPVLSFAYLVELSGDIKLNHEISEISWVPIGSLDTIAFDSNQKILQYVKEKFAYDLPAVTSLVAQLDSTAIMNEQSLYRAILDGYISVIKDNGVLVGMGWIFVRQTMLRKQAVVEDMIVHESQRGKGLGEKILNDLIRWAKEQNVEVIELTTNPKRIAANSLYQKVGFKLHETNHYLLDLRSK